MLAVKLLGQFDVRHDEIPIAIPSRAAQSLLAYLLLTAGTFHRREKLAGLLWPDTLEESARRNLRHELWRLRKAIDTGPPGEREEEFLLTSEFSVAFNPRARYWLDVAVLERARATTASADDLMTTLALYRGELLPGFYDEWVVLERERVAAIFEQEIARLLGSLVREEWWEELAEWGERWIALGGTPEPAYRALMIAHNEMGDQSKVASSFQRCVESLQKELGVQPAEATCLLFEQLKVGRKPAKGNFALLFPVPRASVSLKSATVPHQPPVPGEAPFKGLAYFDECDANLFFGRELLTTRLLSRLYHDRLVVVVGASGSGKSSLVRAGVVPALKQSDPHAQCYLITPTASPLMALAAALAVAPAAAPARDTGSSASLVSLLTDLAREPRSLLLALRRLMSTDASHLVLVVDQFEELFTLCRDEFEREAFIDNLLCALAEADRQVNLIIALRADFYPHCAQYPELREALARHQEYIGPMSAEELGRAVREPARRGGWEFEPGLVDLILRDVGDEPGALPLLSHALLETWKRRRGRMLTVQGYMESGGVRGAIAKTAETVFSQMTADQQHIARNIFLRLTELGEGTQDTRRRAATTELVPRMQDAEQVQTVLNVLAEARLITKGETTVEVAHEALIREWHTLREWLNQNREGLRLHRHLTEAAQSWQKLNQEPGELYRGVRLAQALEWAKTNSGELNPLEREFLEASGEMREREGAEREAQRQRELLAAQRLAEAERRQRDIAEKAKADAEYQHQLAFTRELAVNAVNNLIIDPERSILLALQAVSVSAAGGRPVLREAEEALHRAVQASRVRLTLHGHMAGLSDVAFSPDGNLLATASSDRSAKVWDAGTGQELLSLGGHADVVYKIAFSLDGKRLATASADKTAKIWDAVTGRELLTLRGHADVVRGIAFSPDGRRVATGSFDKTAKIWDSATGEELLTLMGHTGGVAPVAFSPDGARLATGSWTDETEHSVKVWDAVSGKQLLTLTGHASTLWAVAFSPDGKRLATGSGDATAKIWDSTSGQLQMTIFVHSVVMSLAFSRDLQGTRLATGNTNGAAQVWDAMTGELLVTLAGHTGNIYGISLNPDGTRVATGCSDGTARVWDVSPAGGCEWLTIAGHTLQARYIAYSPDGTRVATAGQDKTAKVWDAVTGKVLVVLSGHTNAVNGIAFSPDGSRLVTVSLDQTARVWDVATGKQLLSIRTEIFVFPQGPRVAFSPDGQRIITPGVENSAKVWDSMTGQESLTLCCHAAPVWAAAFSPDGARVATGGWDHMAMIWDSATGKALLRLSGHADNITALRFSPDGRRLATASMDGTTKVWDVAAGKLSLTLSGHVTGVDVAFSPDGTCIATAGADGTVSVWDVSTAGARSEQPLTLYNPSGAMLTGVAFSPDGTRLAASSNDGTVRIFVLPLDDLIAIAKSRVTRTLTNDECQKYLHVEESPLDEVSST
jgi:WD40 repeat protein/DNA-binding SARP family transcriptional activator